MVADKAVLGYAKIAEEFDRSDLTNEFIFCMLSWTNCSAGITSSERHL